MVELLGALSFSALTALIGTCIVGSIVAALRAVSAAMNLAGGGQFHGVVVAADKGEQNNCQRNEKQRNPAPSTN
jgi:hypothetical protein